MKRDTKKLLRELGTLSERADLNTYRRVQIAATVVEDMEWVAEEHGGDQAKAKAWLQTQYFEQLCGWLPLGTMIEIYREFPDEEQWRQHRHNLKAMHLLWLKRRQERTGSKPPKRKTAKLAELQATQAELQAAKAEAQGLRAKAEQLTEALAKAPVPPQIRQKLETQRQQIEKIEKSTAKTVSKWQQRAEKLQRQVDDLLAENKKLRQENDWLHRQLATVRDVLQSATA